jgi:hypothetical protein
MACWNLHEEALAPTYVTRRPSWLRNHRPGPSGQAIRMSLHKEDMPCELSI